MFTKEDRSTFPYWFAHWCAYNMTALNLKCWKFKYLFHDIEKPFLKLFLQYKDVQTWHRKHNKHHPEWLEHKIEECEKYYEFEEIPKLIEDYDYECTLIDWECSQFTKEKGKLTARDFLDKLLASNKLNVEEYKLISSELEKYGL